MSYADNILVQGQVASAAANAGNPVKTGGVYNSAAPSFANGEVADAQVDINGNLKVNVTNGVSGGTAGSPSTTVLTVQGNAGMSAVQVQSATGGLALPFTLVAPATAAVEAVQGASPGPGQVLWVHAGNILATPVYLKFWDLSTAVTLGTTAAKWQMMIPGNTAGATVNANIPDGMVFANAIKCAVTGGISLTDNTNITANSVIVSIGYSA
jgi:hypothetical protein